MKDILSFAVCLTEYLETNGIGTAGTDLFTQSMPEYVQNGVVVAMTGGPILPEDPTRRITFQIQVKNAKSKEGLRQATAINNLLNNQWNVIPGFPGRVVSVTEAGAAFIDSSGTPVYSLNFVVVSTTQR